MSAKKSSNKPKARQAEPQGGRTFTVGMRADDELYERLEAVARVSRRKIAAILHICVEDHLPKMEAALGIKPGEKTADKTVV